MMPDLFRALDTAQYQIAKDAGVGRESLYKSLSKDGNPSFQTIAKVIHALGGRLTIQAA